jgi:hypothetical protein
MTLLKYGEMRKKAFAPVFDLAVYGFSAGQANRIMRALGHPAFERGELLRRLKSLERPRKLSGGFTACLTNNEVRGLVLSLPSLLLGRSERNPVKRFQPVTESDRVDMNERVRILIRSAKLLSERLKLLHAACLEWQENPAGLLQLEVGMEYC